MHVYRYRSPGLLSQKELLYDEWYFASREELNDPIDMQSKFVFSDNSKETWLRIISLLWDEQSWAEVAASYFSSTCPISYENLLRDYHFHSNKVVESIFRKHELNFHDLQRANDLLYKLRETLSLYEPNAGYSVSLSKCRDEMLMWSHYAASHSGYCLIYRPIDGFLNQCPIRVKDSLSVNRGHTSSIGTRFRVENIEYRNELTSIDAFSLLPSYYTGYTFNTEEDRLGFHKNSQNQLLTKNDCWAYEKECRLLLKQPSKHISGKSSYSSFQRLFYYDFKQVVGIIFGARMKEYEKLAIKEIINEKLQNIAKGLEVNSTRTHIFDFLYQQAEICSSSRIVRIVDKELISMGSQLETSSGCYERKLASWKEFKGITIEAGKFSHELIP